ncbi:helix-turn-helix transcriptional regulator [Sphingomonas rhizophila]|uniref:Helix-turn-helix transcriptional regulator n=1 Tax=Sphingomonas rhizophila TaxID=2071607 RepID=A0A7G9S9V0_9SPHN|nr:helix-turn-helix transcriptional regulator [Sphingomonas rhizophila]QNN64625.1 helix-turn-helix transcriptional regulator [Sphingomonas rhizophila]
MPSNQTDGKIAARIREAREYLELNPEEFSEMLSLTSAELQAIEDAQSPVSAALLTEIAKVVGRSLEFFTGDVSAKEASERTDFLARAAETLSEQDIGELQRFAAYLRSRSQSAAA